MGRDKGNANARACYVCMYVVLSSELSRSFGLDRYAGRKVRRSFASLSQSLKNDNNKMPKWRKLKCFLLFRRKNARRSGAILGAKAKKM